MLGISVFAFVLVFMKVYLCVCEVPCFSVFVKCLSVFMKCFSVFMKLYLCVCEMFLCVSAEGVSLCL